MILKIDNDEYIKVIKANTFFKKLMGFMFKKNFKYAMLFKHTNSIHTFFMEENIDVIGIDKNDIVIYKALNIPKNKIIIIKNKKNTSILEMPAFKGKSLKIGEKLTFIRK